MKCPFCGKDNTKVIDSRPTDDSSIRRRRQCDECGKRFTTYEKIESMPLIVIKKDNNREPYDREKITAGIVRSCHKRPVSISQINNMVDEIYILIQLMTLIIRDFMTRATEGLCSILITHLLSMEHLLQSVAVICLTD